VNDDRLTLSEVAEQAGVSPSTLRRWADSGVIPDGNHPAGWSATAAAHARIVARLRERGHSLDHIKKATEDGRLAYGYVEELFPAGDEDRSLEEAAETTGLEPALIERFWSGWGLPPQALERLREEDVQALR
jgi:adenylate cyclase